MKNEVIKQTTETIFDFAVQLMNANCREDKYEIITAINGTLEVIESEVANIEAECDRQKNQASKLRKMLGDDLDRMCDLAGME